MLYDSLAVCSWEERSSIFQQILVEKSGEIWTILRVFLKPLESKTEIAKRRDNQW